MAGGEVIRSQHHQPSGSNWSGVYPLVGSMQLTSPPGRGFRIYADNILRCGPWRDADGRGGAAPARPGLGGRPAGGAGDGGRVAGVGPPRTETRPAQPRPRGGGVPT